MTPRKSNDGAWKYVNKDGENLVFPLCGKHFTGSLTRAVAHFLGITTGNEGVGVGKGG